MSQLVGIRASRIRFRPANRVGLEKGCYREHLTEFISRSTSHGVHLKKNILGRTSHRVHHLKENILGRTSHGEHFKENISRGTSHGVHLKENILGRTSHGEHLKEFVSGSSAQAFEFCISRSSSHRAWRKLLSRHIKEFIS